MKRSHIIAGAIAAAVVLWLVTGLFVGEGEDPGAPAAAAPALAAVQVAELTAEVHERRLALFGRTESHRKVEIRAETSGRVVEKVAIKGETVRAGDVLIRLAMDDRTARLQEAEALLEQREARAEASASLTRSGFAATLQNAEDQAALKAARARLEAVRLEIARTEIRAPFDGVIDDIHVEVGDYVDIYDPVAVAVDLDPIKVVARVSERHAGEIPVGSEAEVRLLTGTTARGTITFVARTGDPATRTFRVDIAVPNPTMAIAEGLTAEVAMPAGQTLAHRISPAILTLNASGVVGVKVVDAEDRVLFQPVAIIDDTPDGMWISGLSERARVITVGQEFVHEGQQVRAVTTPARVADGGETS